MRCRSSDTHVCTDAPWICAPMCMRACTNARGCLILTVCCCEKNTLGNTWMEIEDSWEMSFIRGIEEIGNSLGKEKLVEEWKKVNFKMVEFYFFFFWNNEWKKRREIERLEIMGEFRRIFLVAFDFFSFLFFSSSLRSVEYGRWIVGKSLIFYILMNEHFQQGGSTSTHNMT